MPYLYTVALDAYRFGYPMVRPVLFAEPANPQLRAIDDAFLLGEHLLVQMRGSEPLLPGWRKFDFGEKGDALPDMYIRPGAIIPVGPVMQHDGEKPLDPLTLLVSLDDQNQAMGVLYEDAGDGFAYTKNEARMGYYMASLSEGEVTVRLGRLDGGMGMAKRKLVVRVLLPDGREASTEYWDALDAKVKLP